MATIGRRAAVAEFHGLKLKRFRNRAMVLAFWGWNYLRFDRPIRLILRSEADSAP